MTIGDKDHRRVTVAMAIGFGGLGQAPYFIVGQILASTGIGVFRPNWHRHCSYYGLLASATGPASALNSIAQPFRCT